MELTTISDKPETACFSLAAVVCCAGSFSAAAICSFNVSSALSSSVAALKGLVAFSIPSSAGKQRLISSKSS